MIKEKYNKQTFEDIKHFNEYWEGRELQNILEYTEWRNFKMVINKAKEACDKSNNKISDHFVELNKIVKTGAFERRMIDYKLSRYACYLIVQNGDSRKV